MTESFISLAIGLLFGASLDLAGFGSPQRLNNQFLLRDFSMFKVMFGAIVLGAALYFGFVSAGFSIADSRALPYLNFSIIVGGFLLGFGLVVGGYCPGTALVGLAGGRLDALVFFISIYPGYRIWLWCREQDFFSTLVSQLNTRITSDVQITTLLGLNWAAVVGGLFVVASAGWWFGSILERKSN
jgi:uncharacterized protein